MTVPKAIIWSWSLNVVLQRKVPSRASRMRSSSNGPSTSTLLSSLTKKNLYHTSSILSLLKQSRSLSGSLSIVSCAQISLCRSIGTRLKCTTQSSILDRLRWTLSKATRSSRCQHERCPTPSPFRMRLPLK